MTGTITCPHCGSAAIGTSHERNGRTRHRCAVCGHTWGTRPPRPRYTTPSRRRTTVANRRRGEGNWWGGTE